MTSNANQEPAGRTVLITTILSIRERFHPLFRLRKFRAFQLLTRSMDFPILIRFENVHHSIYASFSKNLSWFLSGGRSGEERERQHFIALIKLANFKRFLDVGANVGLYGFIFRSTVSDGIVTMIEPDADNAKLIRQTITRFGLRDVDLIQAAASDVQGPKIFYKDDISGATGSLERGRKKDAFITEHHARMPSEIKVECITLDELYPGTRQDPDFIKMDVESHELSVLYGAEHMISRSHPALFLECEKNQYEMNLFLTQQGYICFDLCSMQPSDPTTAHNCLALHTVKHSSIVQVVTASRQQGDSLTVGQ